ncbi:MAG: type II toxin-antitoxin system HicA family toxin [Methylovulum sp.]|nr:type II toxin-antitoxin system HicA family toxin [Methylovulum sp.]
MRLLVANGCILHRHGGRHDIYANQVGAKSPVPRHAEIKDSLVRIILKQLNITLD